MEKVLKNKDIDRSARWLVTILSLAGCLLLVTSCASPKPFQMRHIGKSNVDMVIDLHIATMNVHLNELMEKLYKRNPHELEKTPGATIASRQRQIFKTNPKRLSFPELRGNEGIHAMNLAFHPGFRGDRVFALIAGLTAMLRSSYYYRDEYFLLDTLDENRLYKSARNIEIMAWKLKAQHQQDGKPFLVTSTIDGITIDNTSFERIYGKLIANQDMMAQIVADRYNRNIAMIIQNTATFVFIPL